MQEDFKNQLQNALGLWRKKGQGVLEKIIKEARDEITVRLSDQGIAERWPALVNLIEEFLPGVAPAVAGIVGRKVEPLAAELRVNVTHWEPYKIALSVKPQPHLIENQTWQASSLVAMAELAGRWLIEKHTPPGDIKIRVLKVELEVLNKSLSDCTVRCEIDPGEFELAMAQLLRVSHHQSMATHSKQSAEIFLPVMICASNDVLLSQVNFHFEILWAPLLK